jgi:hypothetical protein
MGLCAREARLQHGDWCWNDFSSDDEDVLGAVDESDRSFT